MTDDGDQGSRADGWSRRASGTMLGLALAGGLLVLPPADGMSDAAWRVVAVGTLMAVWWVADVLPRAVTALIPLVAFPALDILPMGEVAPSYAHPLLFLMLGGFVIGHAMERVGLHARLTAALLQPAWVRVGPRRVMGALMVATALLSGIVSNTATVLMMLPLALSMARFGETDARAPHAFALALAYSASIGGMATLVGTPPNAVLAGLSPELTGQGIGFAAWLVVGVPAVLVLLPVAWWVVAVKTYALPAQYARPLPAPAVPAAHPAERYVLAIVALAMVAWITRADKDLGALVVPGWARWLPGKGYELDALVAVAAAVILFVVPGGVQGGRRIALLAWRETERAVPWSVILLLGGGFALAQGIVDSGLTDWIAQGAGVLIGIPPWLGVVAICLVMTFVTELTSNTATAQIALPVLAKAAMAVGIPPLMWMVPATLSASCAFMMPVATAPNAIASEGAGVGSREMAKAGVWLNLLGAGILAALCWVLVPLAFGS